MKKLVMVVVLFGVLSLNIGASLAANSGGGIKLSLSKRGARVTSLMATCFGVYCPGYCYSENCEVGLSEGCCGYKWGNGATVCDSPLCEPMCCHDTGPGLECCSFIAESMAETLIKVRPAGIVAKSASVVRAGDLITPVCKNKSGLYLEGKTVAPDEIIAFELMRGDDLYTLTGKVSDFAQSGVSWQRVGIYNGTFTGEGADPLDLRRGDIIRADRSTLVAKMEKVPFQGKLVDMAVWHHPPADRMALTIDPRSKYRIFIPVLVSSSVNGGQ